MSKRQIFLYHSIILEKNYVGEYCNFEMTNDTQIYMSVNLFQKILSLNISNAFLNIKIYVYLVVKM